MDKHKIYNTNAVRHEMIELQKQTAIILPIIKDHNVALQSFGLCCLKNAASMYRVMISGKLLLKLSIFRYFLARNCNSLNPCQK